MKWITRCGEILTGSQSSLFAKVMIGTSRWRQTSKSLRVCSSMRARSDWGGQGAVGMLAEIPMG
jgi:hypothetical protein